MTETKYEKGKAIELESDYAVIDLPVNTVTVELNVTVFEDGELHTVTRKLDLSDVRDAFREASENYFNDDDTYVLTEKGKEYLEHLRGENK